jgi:hypothetical protein
VSQHLIVHGPYSNRSRPWVLIAATQCATRGEKQYRQLSVVSCEAYLRRASAHVFQRIKDGLYAGLRSCHSIELWRCYAAASLSQLSSFMVVCVQQSVKTLVDPPSRLAHQGPRLTMTQLCINNDPSLGAPPLPACLQIVCQVFDDAYTTITTLSARSGHF